MKKGLALSILAFLFSYASHTFAGDFSSTVATAVVAGTSEWVCPCRCSSTADPDGEWHNLPADHKTEKTFTDCNNKFTGDACEPPTGGKIDYCGKPKWVKTK